MLKALQSAMQEVMGGAGTDQRDVVTKLLTKISTLQGAAAQAEALRRDLHNQLVEIKGNVSMGHGRLQEWWRGRLQV